jgi:hypothetical protein
MRKPRALVPIVLSIMLLATSARADDEPPLHPPPLPPAPPSRWTLQQRAERHLVSGRTLTAIGIAHGVLGLCLNLGFWYGGPTFEGDRPLRSLVIPVAPILGGSAVIMLAVGIPLWVSGARARQRTLTPLGLGPSAVTVAF